MSFEPNWVRNRVLNRARAAAGLLSRWELCLHDAAIYRTRRAQTRRRLQPATLGLSMATHKGFMHKCNAYHFGKMWNLIRSIWCLGWKLSLRVKLRPRLSNKVGVLICFSLIFCRQFMLKVPLRIFICNSVSHWWYLNFVFFPGCFADDRLHYIKYYELFSCIQQIIYSYSECKLR